jgi:hypothetical protein
MKLKLKERQFDTIEEIQVASERVLDTLTEKNFQNAFQNGVDGGTGVYMREGTIWRVMAADRPYGEFYDFYSISPKYFRYHLVKARTPSDLEIVGGSPCGGMNWIESAPVGTGGGHL